MQSGCLFIVSTPIGNLDDMTLRAVSVLKSVDLIAAEDTRHSQRLLSHYQIKTRTVSLHEHNIAQRTEQVQGWLKDGKSIALISDAGTPLISDPGYRLVNTLHREGVQVIPIPGACAAIAALSASGQPTQQFVFIGFLPRKGQQRRQALEQLKGEERTMVFYESVHRVVDVVEQMAACFGSDREVTMAREITKLYESIQSTTLQGLLSWMQETPGQIKGEFVFVLHGAEAVKDDSDEGCHDKVLTALLAELPLKQSVQLAVKLTGGRRKAMYARALFLEKLRNE
jgi:16S rRNA (cytidine1402-2'-O)-methyltransferase